MSLIPAFVVDAFTGAGLVMVPRSGDGTDAVFVDVHDVSHDFADGSTDGVTTLEVRRLSGTPTPGALDRLVSRRRQSIGLDAPALLVVCDHASQGALKRADHLGVSLVGIEQATLPGPTGGVRLGAGRRLPLTPPPQTRPQGARRPSWATVQVLRSYLLLGRLTQRDLAALAGVSQPRIAQATAGLPLDDPLVVLLERWLASYPGPGGVTTYWFGPGPAPEQARAALGAAERAGGTGAVMSGDVAADVIAPLSRPARAVVYARQGIDLRAAGLTPAVSGEATLELTVPQDRGIFAFADRYWTSLGDERLNSHPLLADPLQVLHDLRRSPSVDRDQSEQALRRFLDRSLAPQEG